MGDAARKLQQRRGLPAGSGRRRYARFVPTLEHPARARVTGLSDWTTARRMVADIGLGGFSAWLSPRELDEVIIGDKVYIELYLPEDSFVLSGRAVHRRVVPGRYWTRRLLGVAFSESPDLLRARASLAAYLFTLRDIGAEVHI